MSTTITISDSDLEALRTIRNLVNCDAHLAVLDGVLATAAVAAAAERPVHGALGLGAVHRGIEHRGASEWVCPACGDTCILDFARLMWNCDGCLATFSDESQLYVRRTRELPAGERSWYCDELRADEPASPGLGALANAVVLYPG